MKAVAYERYGSADMLAVRDFPRPNPGQGQVLVRVHAVALNSSDNELLTGHPAYARVWGPLRPRIAILGSDIAGIVEAVGPGVRELQIGDEVFGDLFERWGGLAEYVAAPEEVLVRKPAEISFAQAAALPQAGLVAWQGLRDKGRLVSGERVLIVGAGGGAGSFAIQLASLLGAEVTAVDRASKLDFMRELGARHALDFSSADFLGGAARYDLILDLVGRRSIFDYRRALAPSGRYVMVGGSVPRLIAAVFVGGVLSIFTARKMGILAHHRSQAQLQELVDLVQSGRLRPMVDRTYSLDETATAFDRLGAGQAQGKLVILP